MSGHCAASGSGHRLRLGKCRGKPGGASPSWAGYPNAPPSHLHPPGASRWVGTSFPFDQSRPELGGFYCRLLLLGFYEPPRPVGSAGVRSCQENAWSWHARANGSQEKQWVEEQHFTCLPHPISHAMEREVYISSECPGRIPPFPHGLRSHSHLLHFTLLPCSGGNLAEEPRSDIIPRKQESFNMYDGNGANTTHLLELFNEFPSRSQLPIHPLAWGWPVLGCGSHRWGSMEQGGLSKSPS